MKVFLATYLVAYFLAAFFWRSFLVWKRAGVNPLVLNGSDSAHDYIGRIFKFLVATIVVAVGVYCTSDRFYQYLTPIAWAEHRGMQVIGVVLLLLSLAWTVLAQAQMGESWRIGIDKEHRTPLVRNGVFGLSRNPIFLGMMLTLLGLFLIIPSAATLLTFVMGVVLIQIQVRLEEEFLARSHPRSNADIAVDKARSLAPSLASTSPAQTGLTACSMRQQVSYADPCSIPTCPRLQSFCQRF